jgi:hypothetical protein
MVLISGMFGQAQPVMLSFPYERPMFMREYSTGTCKYLLRAPVAARVIDCLSPPSLSHFFRWRRTLFPKQDFPGAPDDVHAEFDYFADLLLHDRFPRRVYGAYGGHVWPRRVLLLGGSLSRWVDIPSVLIPYLVLTVLVSDKAVPCRT